MLKQEEIKKVATQFAQYQKDYDHAQAAQNQAAMSWDEVIRSLKDYDPEDADRERIISECREQGVLVTPALIRNIHRAFDSLGIVGNKKATIPSRRTTVIKAAVEQALSGKKPKTNHKIRTRRLDTAIDIEQQLEKGRADRAVNILKAKLWAESFQKAGRLIRDHYDVMTIEEAAQYFSEDFVEAWHRTHDEAIGKEKKTNGGK
jgi:hypothetical protein